jgi:Zn-dependent alcohol dehydrogenase
MKAALLYLPKALLRIESIDVAEPVGHEVLVKTASGVCHRG